MTSEELLAFAVQLQGGQADTMNQQSQAGHTAIQHRDLSPCAILQDDLELDLERLMEAIRWNWRLLL